MKNSQKGFAPVFLVLIIVAVLALGTGTVVYYQNKQKIISQQPDVAPPQQTNPIISSITPNSISVGSVLTINGSGFSYQRPSGNVGMGPIYRRGLLVMFQNSQIEKIDAFVIDRGDNTNDNQITFTIPPQGCDNYRNEIDCSQIPITAGKYSVSVWTALGWSNSIPLTILAPAVD